MQQVNKNLEKRSIIAQLSITEVPQFIIHILHTQTKSQRQSIVLSLCRFSLSYCSKISAGYLGLHLLTAALCWAAGQEVQGGENVCDITSMPGNTGMLLDNNRIIYVTI